MNQAVDLYGLDLIFAMGLVALIGGFISGKDWGSRVFGSCVAVAMLSLGWLMVAGIAYVAVNLGAEAIEAMSERAFSADSRNLLSKWLGFAGVTVFYAYYVWEEYQTPASAAGPRMVAGRCQTGRNFTKFGYYK